ncbi:response regulator transcription factor [soil metagenome]
MTSLSIAIIAADRFVRAGLVSLLQGQPGLSVVADLAPDDDLRGLELEADVVVWDVVVWDAVVWDAVVWDVDLELDVLSLELDAPVLALVPEDADLADFPNVNGVLYRTASVDKLEAAVKALAEGLSVLEPELAQQLFPQTPEADTLTQNITEDLTPRELDVLQHLAAGLSNKAIAKVLDISENTVKFHVAALLSKFGVGSRTEVVVRALQSGQVNL